MIEGTVVLVVLAALCYALFIENQKRRRAEADLAVMKVRRPLEDINKELAATQPLNYVDHPIPAYMYDYVSPSADDLPGGDDSDLGGDGSGTKEGSGNGDSGVH